MRRQKADLNRRNEGLAVGLSVYGISDVHCQARRGRKCGTSKEKLTVYKTLKISMQYTQIT